MRVLIVEPDSRGGNWHYATALGSALEGLGIRVVLATLYPVEAIPALSDLRVVSIGRRSDGRDGTIAGILGRLARHLDKLIGLRRVVTEFNPEVIHIHGALGKLDGVYFRWLRARGIRVCYTAHWMRSLDGVRSKAEASRHRSVDALIVHSADGAARLEEQGVELSRIRKIAHLNLSHLHGPPLPQAAARERLGIARHSSVILFFGVIEPRKGLDALINAFAYLVRSMPDLRLVIAGAAPGGFDAYASQLDDLGIREHVTCHIGYVPSEEIPTYFSAADVVVLPYRRIVQSGILQLAYGFERPVVVSNVGGIADMVQEDGTGIVARSLQVEDLAEAIRHLLRSPEEARAMGARGRTLNETKYSWPAVASQVAEIYRTIVRVRSSA